MAEEGFTRFLDAWVTGGMAHQLIVPLPVRVSSPSKRTNPPPTGKDSFQGVPKVTRLRLDFGEITCLAAPVTHGFGVRALICLEVCRNSVDGRGVGTGMATLNIPVSLLDRANSREGSSEAHALQAVAERAESAEKLGFKRFWVAEHHAVAGIAGSAPAVLMAALAARTRSIRIGSGGMMLPNHQPLVVAEQAATLNALYPGRIDLGVGRSVGFTSAVRRALRAGKAEAEQFEEQLAELLAYLDGTASITARPQDHGQTPVFVLATGAGADIAARAGLALVLGGPTLFRSSPESAVQRYRKAFRPSLRFPRPYVLAAVNVAVAGTGSAAADLLLPEANALADSRSKGVFPALAATDGAVAGPDRRQELVRGFLADSVHGTPPEVRRRLLELLEATGADEVLATGGAFDVDGQLESDRLLAELASS